MNEIINYKLHNLKRIRSVKKWNNFNYLKKLSAERLYERLFEVKRNFDLGLEIGCHSGEFGTLIKNKKKIKKLIQVDTVFEFCKNSKKTNIPSININNNELPFREYQFDIVISNFYFHWIRDVPKILTQIRNLLKPNGLLLINFLGGKTLRELQINLIDIEMQLLGGSSPRVIPFIDIRSAGALAQNTGFKLPVVDSEIINITHTNITSLFHDLRGMGETNCMTSIYKPLKRVVTKELENRLINDKIINTVFELITITAWKE